MAHFQPVLPYFGGNSNHHNLNFSANANQLEAPQRPVNSQSNYRDRSNNFDRRSDYNKSKQFQNFQHSHPNKKPKVDVSLRRFQGGVTDIAALPLATNNVGAKPQQPQSVSEPEDGEIIDEPVSVASEPISSNAGAPSNAATERSGPAMSQPLSKNARKKLRQRMGASEFVDQSRPRGPPQPAFVPDMRQQHHLPAQYDQFNGGAQFMHGQMPPFHDGHPGYPIMDVPVIPPQMSMAPPVFMEQHGPPDMYPYQQSHPVHPNFAPPPHPSAMMPGQPPPSMHSIHNDAYVIVQRLLDSGRLPAHMHHLPRDQLVRVMMSLPEYSALAASVGVGVNEPRPEMPPPPQFVLPAPAPALPSPYPFDSAPMQSYNNSMAPPSLPSLPPPPPRFAELPPVPAPMLDAPVMTANRPADPRLSSSSNLTPSSVSSLPLPPPPMMMADVPLPAISADSSALFKSAPPAPRTSATVTPVPAKTPTSTAAPVPAAKLFPALRDNSALCAEFFTSFPPLPLRCASAEIAYTEAGSLAVPASGLSLHFSAQNVVLRCVDVQLTAERPPPCALRMFVSLRSEVWVPCAAGQELARPFLKLLSRAGPMSPHFRIRTYLSRSERLSDSDVFDFFTERSVGNQIFLTNMLINDEYGLFLLPCRLMHPDGSGNLLGGHSGRRGGSLAPSSSLPHDGVPSLPQDEFSARAYSAGVQTVTAANNTAASVCREVVFEAFVLPLRKLYSESLSSYALPALENERLQCVLDLDKTIIVSVRADQATPAQRAVAIGTAFPLCVNEVELILIPRPGLCDFLKLLATRFDFSFCTMGTREYAAEIFRLLKSCYPDVPWSACREVVSADFTRICSNRLRGQKELRMMFTYAHWARWRNTTVIVDDTVDVWTPEHIPLIYRIPEFVGPAPGVAPVFTDLARQNMDAGLSDCWRVLSTLHSMYFAESRRLGASPLPANVVSSSASLAPEALKRVPLLQQCSVADLLVPALQAVAAEAGITILP